MTIRLADRAAALEASRAATSKLPCEKRLHFATSSEL
jgi:hypothetical protein